MRISWPEFVEWCKPDCKTCPIADEPKREIIECMEFCLMNYARMIMDKREDD